LVEEQAVVDVSTSRSDRNLSSRAQFQTNFATNAHEILFKGLGLV